jgi:hypothetical protein
LKKVLGIKADILGIAASFACAVHCSIVPVLLAFSSLGMFAWLQEEWVEVLFLLSAFVFSFWSILPSFLKDKSQSKAFVFMLFGLLLLLFGYFTHLHDGSINAYSVSGGIALCLAHWLNYKQQQSACLTTF